jgi:hypothetical protein
VVRYLAGYTDCSSSCITVDPPYLRLSASPAWWGRHTAGHTADVPALGLDSCLLVHISGLPGLAVRSGGHVVVGSQ